MSSNFNKPVYLVAKDIEVSFGNNLVLDKANISIHQGDHIGLIGRNGTGKTTFLKILNGLIKPDNGKIEKKRDLTIGYLSQDFTLDMDKTVYENLLEGASAVLKLISEYESLDHDSERKHELEEEILQHDGWNLDQEINSLINNMRLPARDTMITNFSGGEKRRIALAKAVLSKPDVLIFDEPTNHLDTQTIEWLEKFLIKYPGACIFVTHDRYFLDRVSTRIVELSNHIFYSHPGNYTNYLEKKAERVSSEEGQEKNRQRFLKRELEWVRQGPQGRQSKSQGRMDRYDEMSSQEGPEKELDVDVIIPPAPRLSDRILNIKNLGMEIGGKRLFSNLNINFEAGMRLGIVGNNGLGKTTLLKIMLGQLAPTEGSSDTASRTEINYADQEKMEINDNDTIIEALNNGQETMKFGDRFIPVRSYLKRFLFSDERMKSLVKNLSGGERSRLLLAKILKNGGNFLILDEPTNDLDLPTLRVLEEALTAFEGCVVVVSHDRYFLNRVCTHILGFEGEGRVRLLGGDYDFYKKYSNENAYNSNVKGQPGPSTGGQKAIVQKPDQNQLKELKKLEKLIEEAEKEVVRRESVFSEPDFYIKHGEKIGELSEGVQLAKRRVEDLYKKWEALS